MVDITPRKIYSTFIFVMGVSYFFVRRLFKGTVCTNESRLDGKTVLITGANSGIGAATAEDMAKRGARVIMACRDMLKAERVAFNIVERTGTKQLVVQHVDLSSFDSIRNFASRINSQEKRLDILINNAGVANRTERSTMEGLELEFGINHMGHFLLTMMLLDLMKKSTPSRIINVSSYDHRCTFNFDNLIEQRNYNSSAAYTRSKLANLLFSKELARRLSARKSFQEWHHQTACDYQHTGVVCMSAQPGFTNTSLWRESAIWWQFLSFLLIPILPSSNDGAQTIIDCALRPTTPEMFRGKASFFSNCQQETPDRCAENDEDARSLWEWSEQFVRNNGYTNEDY